MRKKISDKQIDIADPFYKGQGKDRTEKLADDQILIHRDDFYLLRKYKFFYDYKDEFIKRADGVTLIALIVKESRGIKLKQGSMIDSINGDPYDLRFENISFKEDK